MTAGCEFVCKNKDCKYTNCGVNMHGPWSLSPIDQVIDLLSADTKKNRTAAISELNKMKDGGRTLALLPNQMVGKLPVLGYRIQLWSPEAKTIWNFDVLKEEYPGENLEECLANWPKPSCPKTGCKLIQFSVMESLGIECPHCGERMKQNRWFTNA